MAEAASGRNYSDLLRTLVYRPLGLRRTVMPTGYLIPSPFMHGYDVPASGAPEDISTAISASGVWASGGLISTPRDTNAFAAGSGRPTGRPSARLRAEAVEDEVRAGQVGRRGRLVAPLHDAVGPDDDQRALREAGLVEHAEGARGGALGLEVRELLDGHPQLL